MKRLKIVSILMTTCLILSILVQPMIVYGYGDGGADSGSGGRYGQGDGSGQKSGSGSHEETGDTVNDDGEEHVHDDGEEGGGGSGSGGPGTGRGGQDKGSGSGGMGGSKKDVGGTITLVVTVGWPEDVILQEVDVTLFREGISNTITTVGGVATFYSEPSGDCTLRGEAVPGFSIPEEQIMLTGDSKTVDATLVYERVEQEVTGISLNKTNISLVKGYKEQLISTVEPANANEQGVTWSSDDNSVASVADGLVEGLSTGEAKITVTTVDGNKTATCDIIVASITSLNDPDQVTALKNEWVVLPDTVVANLDRPLNGESTIELPVTWFDGDGNELVRYFQVPLAPNIEPIDEDYIITLEGHVDHYESTATLEINVDMLGTAILVEGIALNKNLLSITEGTRESLIATIIPEDATTQDVIWSSSNESVAAVDENGLVVGISKGQATITVMTVAGGLKTYCLVSVGVVPEIELIYPTLEGGVFEEHFDNLDEIYINVENLVNHLKENNETFSEAKYYVKVEDKGGTEPLGSGLVTIYEDTMEFNLYEVTQFVETENYSSRYFVYMSQFEDYPKDDEKTLMTNFMGGTSTPTIPVENVKVTVEMIGGNLETPEGIIFLLAREEIADKLPEDIIWQDYYEGDSSILPYDSEDIDLDTFLDNFVDEVKMMGVAGDDGKVVWIPPRETLKLGGYLLLEVTPSGYVDNLNLINPDSEDREQLKAVHLMRDGSVERHVVNIYTGASRPVDDQNNSGDDDQGNIGNDDQNSIGDDDQSNTGDDEPGNNPPISGGSGSESSGGSGGGPKGTSSNPIIKTAKLTLDSFKELMTNPNLSGHWSLDHIIDLVKKGIFKESYKDTLVDVNGLINEAEVLELIEIASKNENFDSSYSKLKDIKSMTRQEVMVMLMIAFGFDKSENTDLVFSDAYEIEEDAKGYVSKSYELEIIKGYEDNTFRPNNIVTRAEFYTMLSKCLGL